MQTFLSGADSFNLESVMSGFLLSRSKREEVRSIARRAYIAHSGDKDAAIRAASDDLRVGSIVIAILLGVAIQLAIDLIVHWIEQNILEPAPSYTAGEPGEDEE